MTSRREDRLVWSDSNRGEFDLKSTYALAMDYQETQLQFSGWWVWKLDTLPRIKFFIWMCLHNSIGVGVCLARRGLRKNETCQLCQREPETILHGLRDCMVAKYTWAQLGINSAGNFFEGDIHQWLSKNCKDSTCHVENYPSWRIIFPFAIWLIWKQRNNMVFNNRPYQANLHKDILFSASEFQNCALSPKNAGARKVKRVRWERPQPDGFVLT